MLFGKVTIASTLALAGWVSASPQIVVTVTDTVTYTPPLSTSTFTKVVTVTASSSSESSSKSGLSVKSTSSIKMSTSTTKSTVTTTISSGVTGPSETNCPVQLYYQCGGSNWEGCTACVSGATCTSQNPFYFQCVAAPTFA